MTENKNLLEELRDRELSDKGSCAMLLGWNGGRCEDFGKCDECRYAALNALADRIEREFVPASQTHFRVRGFEWPRFEDGKLVLFGDEFMTDDDVRTRLTTIELHADGSVEMNPEAALGCDRMTLEGGERVRRTKLEAEYEGDTQKSIDEDAKMEPFQYCASLLDWDLYDIVNGSLDEMRAEMQHDLLKRQRALLEQR